MALTANTTGRHFSSGNWERISTEGEVFISCASDFTWAMTASSATVPTVGHVQARPRNDPEDGMSIKLASGQHLWIHAYIGTPFTITATAPVI